VTKERFLKYDLFIVNMIKPRTKETDYLAFEDERERLENRMLKREISSEVFDQKYSLLVKKYEARVHPEDIHLFNTFEEYQDFLNHFNLHDNAQKALDHEYSHVKKANELGYPARYGCMLLIPKCPLFSVDGSILTVAEVAIKPFIRLEGRITKEHLKEILEAPSEPSDRDKDICELLERI